MNLHHLGLLQFVSLLKEEGLKNVDAFLTAHADDLGQRSTADVDVLLAQCRGDDRGLAGY